MRGRTGAAGPGTPEARRPPSFSDRAHHHPGYETIVRGEESRAARPRQFFRARFCAFFYTRSLFTFERFWRLALK